MMRYLAIVFYIGCSAVLFAQDQETPVGKIYMGSKGGQNWKLYDEGLPADVQVNEVVEKGNLLFAATEAHGLFVRWDKAPKWIPSGKGITGTKVDALMVYRGSIFAGTFQDGIYRSDDDGATWYAVNEGLTQQTVRAFMVVEERLLAGTNDGIFLLNGNKWEQRIGKFQVNDFAQVNGKIFATTNRGVITASGIFDQWKMAVRDVAVRALSVMGEVILVSTYQSGVVKIDKDGNARTAIDFGIPRPVIYYVTPVENFLLGQMNDGLYKSFDQGQTWKKVEDNLREETMFREMRPTRSGIVAWIGSVGC